MRKIHICIIDEPLNLEELYQFHPYAPQKINLLQVEDQLPPWFSHGTLCTGLLIESAYSLNILKHIIITHISISNSEGKRDYKKIISALQLCSKMDFDIISMSVGLFKCDRGKDMIALISKMKHTVMVCAAANDFSLVYPASLPSVIGVKRALERESPVIGLVEEPPDGIELSVNFPTSDYLKELSTFYCDDFTGSNSVLVPQVCMILANEMVKKQDKMTKQEAMLFFSKIGLNSFESKYTLPQCIDFKSGNSPPIVFLPRGVNTNIQKSGILTIQEIFENSGYPCSIISDIFLSSDFERGWYRLDVFRPRECLAFYQEAVSDSLILLFSELELVKKIQIDLTLKDWEDLFTIGAVQIYKVIMDKLG